MADHPIAQYSPPGEMLTLLRQIDQKLDEQHAAFEARMTKAERSLSRLTLAVFGVGPAALGLLAVGVWYLLQLHVTR